MHEEEGLKDRQAVAVVTVALMGLAATSDEGSPTRKLLAELATKLVSVAGCAQALEWKARWDAQESMIGALNDALTEVRARNAELVAKLERSKVRASSEELPGEEDDGDVLAFKSQRYYQSGIERYERRWMLTKASNVRSDGSFTHWCHLPEEPGDKP